MEEGWGGEEEEWKEREGGGWEGGEKKDGMVEREKGKWKRQGM